MYLCLLACLFIAELEVAAWDEGRACWVALFFFFKVAVEVKLPWERLQSSGKQSNSSHKPFLAPKEAPFLVCALEFS